MKQAEEVTFGGSALDRAAHLRNDPTAIHALLSDEGAGVLPIWRGKPLLDAESRAPEFLPLTHPAFKDSVDQRIFLGFDEGHSRFAQDVSAWEPDDGTESVGAFVDPSEQTHPELPASKIFAELRANMAYLTPRDAELVATAKALVGWHAIHPFCAQCGKPTVQTHAGWQRDCPDCKASHFPRTDPVVIMLITLGNSVLMGRSPGWPEGMYSLLAGFLEPGETIEAAVRREVWEEAGVKVGDVTYLASQPWPFPASLMIGCMGDAVSRELKIDPNEIEDALWVTREEMAEALAGGNASLKPARKGSIARFLIEKWLADRLD